MLSESFNRKVQTLASFSALQTLIHGLLAVSGFIIVRTLNKAEFAAYTVAAALQAVASLLTDSGIGAGVTAVGGRIWKDPAKLSDLVATALRMRTQLAFGILPMAAIFGFVLLRHHEYPAGNSFVLLAAVGLSLIGSFMASVYSVPLRLASRYRDVQKADLGAAVLRILLILAIFSFWSSAVSAMLITTFALAYQGVSLRTRAAAIITPVGTPDENDRRVLTGLLKKQFLMTLFLAFQGQITVWIISVMGSADKTADIGALSRLAIIFSIVTSIATGLAAPTFARCESVSRLTRLFIVMLAAYAVFATVLLGYSFLFPETLLWILGNQYQSLNNELVWMVINASLAGLTGVMYSFAAARGWIWHTWIIPIATIIVEGVAICFVDLSEVRGVLVVGFVALLPNLIVTSLMALRGLRVSWKSGVLLPIAA